MTSVFIKHRRGKFGYSDGEKTEAEVEKPRNTWKLEEARKDSPLETWRGSSAG